MEKSNDVKIFLLCFKKKNYEFINDSVVTPLQVGADVNKDNVCELKDNTGDNISKNNLFFVECTGTYWIWKNVHDCKYKGQMQYRRPLLNVNEDFDFDLAFNKYDAITMEPIDYELICEPKYDGCPFIPAHTVKEGYGVTNSIFDIERFEYVIKEYFTDYYDDYLKYIVNDSILYYSNGFILKEKDYDRYCEFLFSVLSKFRECFSIETDEDLWFHVARDLGCGGFDSRKYPTNLVMRYNREHLRYQTSIGGFLSERIFTLWLRHNFSDDKILKIPYDKQEPGMWI